MEGVPQATQVNQEVEPGEEGNFRLRLFLLDVCWDTDTETSCWIQS